MEPGESSSKPSRHMKNRLQLAILEAAYTVNKKPSAVMKEVVADMTGLTTKEVTAWYGNKRFCERHGPRRKKTDKLQAVGPKSANLEHIGQPSTILMSHEEHAELLQPLQIQSMPIQQSTQHATQAHNVATSLGLEKQSPQLSVDPHIQKQHPHTSATNIQQANPNPATMNPKEVGLSQKTKWIEPVRVYQRRKGRVNWVTFMGILTLLPGTQDPTIDKEQLDSFSEKEGGTAGRDWNAKETNTTTAIADTDDDDDAGILAGARPIEKATAARYAKEATSYTAGRGKSDHIEVIDLDSE